MKGFVPTPKPVVDAMVRLLFEGREPSNDDVVLDPGCGTGEFIDGVLRWCDQRGIRCPRIVGVESDPRHIPALTDKYRSRPNVLIEHRDYLCGNRTQFKYVIGNPPYVPITQLSELEKERYRRLYATAQRRFDLYLLFFEQAINNLAPNGRLVFITPEKYLYVETAGVLRDLLSKHHVEIIELVDEATFGSLVTYPTITVFRKAAPGLTSFKARNEPAVSIQLPQGTGSWMPFLMRSDGNRSPGTLADICSKISCGIATGADSVFVLPRRELGQELVPFARPTIAGRELKVGHQEAQVQSCMVLPYDASGRLIPEENLGALGEHLRRPDIRSRLLARTCVARKPWYAFHETPVLPDLLRPKILCKDICEHPVFVPDYSGRIVPRHSVYYLVPRSPEAIPGLLEYLNSEVALRWLHENCQRAAKGYLRLQSRTLQRLPIAEHLLSDHESGPMSSLRSYHIEQLALHI